MKEGKRNSKSNLMTCCIVPILLRYYMIYTVSSLGQFSTRLSSLPLSKQMLLPSKSPLIHHRLRVEGVNQGTCQWLSIFESDAFVLNKLLNTSSSYLLSENPAQFSCTSDLYTSSSAIDSTKVCSRNKEPKYLELWQHRSLMLHGSSSN